MQAQDTKAFIEKKLNERKVSLNGSIYKISDGIANIFGLDDVMLGELLFFPRVQSYGIALNLENFGVGAVLLTEGADLVEGDKVEPTGRLADVSVSPSVIGSVVDGFGDEILPQIKPLEYFKDKKVTSRRPFESAAPSIMSRFPVKKALQTGLLAVDSLIPIGRGQRELLIGDRQTGKTQVALDTIVNLSNQYDRELQRYENGELKTEPKPVICVYVAIGQRASQVAELRTKLEEQNALKQTVIVAATASAAASVQYMSPFTGTAIAETFMVNCGLDTLIIYDDLSRHAQAYREMSLLLRRPPGREAYPGDIFYVHSRLLERSAKLNEECGGGSLTALPIIETLAGDISAYIPTNVISITDGQVFFSKDLFNEGTRPAIDVGLSVSRVGSAAQPKNISSLTSKLKLVLAQYRELKVFTQFSSDVDKEAQEQLNAGEKLTKLFIQAPSSPYPEYLEFAIVSALSGPLKEIELSEIQTFVDNLIETFETCLVQAKTPKLQGALDYIQTYESGNRQEIDEALNKYWSL